MGHKFFPCMNCKKSQTWETSVVISLFLYLFIYIFISLTTYVNFYIVRKLGFSCRGIRYFCFVWLPSVLTDVLFLI